MTDAVVVIDIANTHILMKSSAIALGFLNLMFLGSY